MTMLNVIYKNDNNFFNIGFNALLESLFPAAMFRSSA
ncbi:LuxR family transcriptional regulator, partial [Klebsiella oxytoca]|nr:LuxR family transcriptional regulator [Klebsiella oxytoca]